MNWMPEPDEDFEMQAQEIAHHLPYPPTPDVVDEVLTRLHPARPVGTVRATARFATALGTMALLLMLVPGIRAAVQVLIGADKTAVQVDQIDRPTAQVAAISPTPDVFALPEMKVEHRAILDLPGDVATSFVEARSVFPSPILLPAYPENLGQPDVVYLFDSDTPYVILGWLDSTNHDLAISLHMVSVSSYVTRQFLGDYGNPAQVASTTVNGSEAFWVTSPHKIKIFAKSSTGFLKPYSWEVLNHVLVWKSGNLAYRLETYVSLEEAIHIAESLE